MFITFSIDGADHDYHLSGCAWPPQAFIPLGGKFLEDDPTPDPVTCMALMAVDGALADSDYARNLLWRALPATLKSLLQERLERVDLPAGFVLIQANAEIKYVYFLLDGLASQTGRTTHGQLEIGVIGREGMSAPTLLLEADRTPHDTSMQVAGSGLRIAAKELASLFHREEALRSLLLKYVQYRAVQTAETLLAAGRFNIKERAARWLLMCHDRIDGDLMPITHEFLSAMLGVRRAGVTDSIHILEGMRSIRSMRGWIEIRNRSALEAVAGDSYGAPEFEFARLIGPWMRPLRSSGV